MINYTNYKNSIKINNKLHYFKYDIYDVKSNESLIFVLLDTFKNSSLNEEVLCNVFAYDFIGNFKWKIKNMPSENVDVKKTYPLVLMNVNEKESLFVTDFMGRKFRVDKNTGSIILIGAFR